MSILVVYNLGARDVMLDGQQQSPARQKGEQLLETYAAVASRLSAPIIEPCLEYILAQQPTGVDWLVLFGTDQPDPQYQPSDTLYFGQLLARLLPERIGAAIRCVMHQPVHGINPALYDEALEKLDELLSGLPNEGVTVCYAILSGGTPACNTALLLQGVRHYGDRLRVVYMPQGGEAQELRVGQQVTGAFREAAAIEHLQRLDFANAVPFLQQMGTEPALVGLANYAAQRFSFDFRSAQETLLQVMRDGDRSIREYVRSELRHDLDQLPDKAEGTVQMAALIRELYWNAAITYQHRRYADFLGRIYRFQEAVLRYLVEQIFELPTDLAPSVRDANQARWNEGIRNNPALLHFLESQHMSGRALDWQEIGRPTYRAMLSYATSDKRGLDASGKPLLSPQERRRYQALLDKVNAFDQLVELRHRTIIGHGFEGVSDELILRNYKGQRKQDGTRQTPVEGLAEILVMSDIDVRRNPYQSLAEFLISRLRR